MAFAARVHATARQSGSNRDTRSSRPTPDGSKPVCSACKRTRHTLKSCFRVTGNFSDWWGARPRDRTHLSDTDLSKPVLVPDVRGRELFDQTKQQNASAPRAHMTSAQPLLPGNVPSTSSSSLSSLDRIDLNSLAPRELEDLTLLWQTRKGNFNSTDRLSGPYLEYGDWCG